MNPRRGYKRGKGEGFRAEELGTRKPYTVTQKTMKEREIEKRRPRKVVKNGQKES